MLKTKKMPKQKQNKKQTQNDGKITKKNLKKPKIIGGKIIQQLSLKEKLEFLKQCLVKNAASDDYFKLFKIIDSVSDYDDTFFDNSISTASVKKISDFDNCLKDILLCLSDHDDYNSYALLNKTIKSINITLSDQKKITELSETVDISDDKMSELSTKSELYFNKYKIFLEDFINKVVNSDTGSDDVGADAGGTDGNGSVPDDDTGSVPDDDTGSVREGDTDDDAESPSRTEPAKPRANFGDVVGGGIGSYYSKYIRPKDDMSQAKIEENLFETSMFQIYTDGIVLLTIDGQNYNNPTLKVFKGINKKEDTEISGKDAIINFFNTKTDILIIRRYNDGSANDDYYWDCRIQLMYKLVKILIENIGGYEDALKTQLQTNLKDKRFLLKYKTNLLDKLIAIIFEKLPDDVTDIKYGIILTSLKVIILNNEGIDDKHIDEKYTKYLTNRSIKTTNIESIIGLSNDKMPKNKFAAKCDSRREYFEHIINVLYTNKNKTEIYGDADVNEELEILIKLSASASPGISLFGKTLNEDNCRTTINGYIKKYKSYLISEAYIGKLELLADYNNKYIQDSEYSSDSNSSKTLISQIGSDELRTIEADAKKYREKINNYINNEPHLIARDSYLDVPVKMIAIFNEFIKDYEKIFKHYNLKLYKIARSKVLEIK
jgi:hypothetical protein